MNQLTDQAELSAPEFFSLQVRDARRFYLDLAPPAQAPLVVVCGGSERCTPDYVIQRSSFPYFSIEFVAAGKGALSLDGTDYSLTAGSVFSYGPGISQNITTAADSPLVKYFVDFVGTDAADLLSHHTLTPGTVGRVFVPVEIQSTFDELIRNGAKGTGLAAELCSTLLQYLIVKIADSMMPWQASQTPAFDTYRRCREHIQEHFVRLKTLAQVARECHVDRAYLCRLFRRYDHQTPYQYLIRLKMNLAAERLQHPGVLVKQVAAEMGFEDPFHFSRAFKNAFGVSPKDFRHLR